MDSMCISSAIEGSQSIYQQAVYRFVLCAKGLGGARL